MVTPKPVVTFVDMIFTYCKLLPFDVHWVPLTTNSVTTSTRLQQADFFVSKSLTAMLNVRLSQVPACNQQFICCLPSGRVTVPTLDRGDTQNPGRVAAYIGSGVQPLPLGDKAAQRVLAMWRAVCFLCSRRRTFWFCRSVYT